MTADNTITVIVPTVDTTTNKLPFNVKGLIIGLLFSTYFLTAAIIEYSLISYVTNTNAAEAETETEASTKAKQSLFIEWLVFKKAAPIWSSIQLFIIILLPFIMLGTAIQAIQSFTKRATIIQHLLDCLQLLQLVGILYLIIGSVMPLEDQLKSSIIINTDSTASINIVVLLDQLKPLYFIALLLNIVGWILPILRYNHWRSIGSPVVAIKTDTDSKKLQ